MVGMRRREKEISERVVIEEVLREQEVGRLATSVGDEPYIVPINFVYTNNVIIFHSHNDGKKMINISQNPRVCFEVDTYEKVEGEKPCDYAYKYHSVVIRGIAKPIIDPDAKLTAMMRLSDKYAPGKEKLLRQADLAKYQNLVVYSIEVEEMTGKRSPVKPSSG